LAAAFRRPPRRSLRPRPRVIVLALLAVLVSAGGLVWLRSRADREDQPQSEKEATYAQVQERLDEALTEVLPDLAAATSAADAWTWAVPGHALAAAIRCRVVPVRDGAPWPDIQARLAKSVQRAGGAVLWSEPLPPEDLLRLDVGVPGLATHTLVLYRAAAARPAVGWGEAAGDRAWRALRAAATGPVVALVIDDWGYRTDDTTRALLALDAPLTLSILPGLAHSRRFAGEATDLVLPARGGAAGAHSDEDAARRRAAAGCPVTIALGPDRDSPGDRRREIFLHLPMEPEGYPEVDPGAQALLVGMPRPAIAALLDRALAGLPGVRGVNNHMGSAATADEGTMRDLLAELKARDLVFLDSLTTAGSVAYTAARDAGLPAARNRVFLDHDRQDLDSIRRRLASLVESARASGFAVGIGHPHPETLQILREELPRWRAAGVSFVTLSELLALQATPADAGV